MRVGKDGSRDTDVRNVGSRAAGRSARDLLIAADFGTSGVKLAALDRSLSLNAVAMRAYPLSLPVSGQAEQAPADWWKALAEGIADLRGLIPDLAERSAALVFCAQMCGVVATDASGAPLRPAIVWLDKRAGTMSRQMNGGFPSLAGYRLDNDGCDLIAPGGKGLPHMVDVIVIQRQGVLGQAGGNARGVRHAEGESAGTGLYQQ